MTYVLISVTLFSLFLLMGIYLIYSYNKIKVIKEALQFAIDMSDRSEDRCSEYRKKIIFLEEELYGDNKIELGDIVASDVTEKSIKEVSSQAGQKVTWRPEYNFSVPVDKENEDGNG